MSLSVNEGGGGGGVGAIKKKKKGEVFLGGDSCASFVTKKRR